MERQRGFIVLKRFFYHKGNIYSVFPQVLVACHNEKASNGQG